MGSTKKRTESIVGFVAPLAIASHVHISCNYAYAVALLSV